MKVKDKKNIGVSVTGNTDGLLVWFRENEIELIDK